LVSGHPTPEEAVISEDSAPSRFVNVVAVEYSPREDHAVVLIEYNEPPVVEPYVVLFGACFESPAAAGFSLRSPTPPRTGTSKAARLASRGVA
jgi:hypothetical protein